MDLHLPTLIRSKPVEIKRKELKFLGKFEYNALRKLEKENGRFLVPKLRPMKETPTAGSKPLQNFNTRQDVHSKIQFQQKLLFDFPLQQRTKGLKMQNHRSMLNIQAAASKPASYENSEQVNFPKSDFPRAIGTQPIRCQSWKPINRPKPYTPTTLSIQPARDHLKTENYSKPTVPVPADVILKQTRDNCHMEQENRPKSCLTMTVKNILDGIQNFGPGDHRTKLASKSSSETSCLKSWNWTPAPEVRSPDRFQKDVGDGKHWNPESEPMEDVYGVMTILNINDADSFKALKTEPVSDDEKRTLKFRLAQVIPYTFFLLEKWVDLQPGGFQVMPSFTTQVQMTDDNAHFYVEPRPGTKSYDPEFFLVKVVSPSGRMPFVHVLRDTVNKNRLRCSFYPEEPGTHVASVNLGVRGEHHIDGSPLSMNICRNYALYGSRTVSIKNLAMDQPLKGCELEIYDRFRIGGITTTEYGNALYATDTIGGQIWKFSNNGGYLLLTEKHDLLRCNVGGRWSCKPTAIAYDRSSQLLLVTDCANHQVCKFTLNGRFVMNFGHEGMLAGEFKTPNGIAVSSKGVIAVVDLSNHRIQLFTESGGLIHHRTIYDGRARCNTKAFLTPCGIVFNPAGDRIYYADTTCEVVYVLGLDLEFIMSYDHTAFGTPCTPVGLALDDIGNLLVCDPGSNVVRVFNPNGVLIHTIFATGPNPLEGPEQILVLPGGVCCVLDKVGTQFRIF